jgi:hypothetical protein
VPSSCSSSSSASRRSCTSFGRRILLGRVEVGVQIAERWMLARLRNQTFFSLDELNQRIGELVEDINGRVMRRYGESRRQLFERLDRPARSPSRTTRAPRRGNRRP